MHFNLITATSLSLLLFLSTSIQPAFAFTQPDEVSGDERYSLTLMANPSKILVSDDSDGIVNSTLKVQTFDPAQPWDAGNVGPDKSRKWNMYDGLESLLNVQSNGYLYFDRSLKTDGQVYPTNSTHVDLVQATGNLGNGIKIRLQQIVPLVDIEAWVDENGRITFESENAAIWAITRLKAGKTRRFRQLR